jgi:hypothetical protein
VFVQKEESGESLRLRGCGYVVFSGQMSEERFNLSSSQFTRMSTPMKQNVAPNPGDVLLFGAVAVVTNAYGLAHLVAEAKLGGHVV